MRNPKYWVGKIAGPTTRMVEKSVLEWFVATNLGEIMAILVTGGAGYIGSVTVERLATNGESIVVLDDLSYEIRQLLDATGYECRPFHGDSILAIPAR